MVFCDSTDDVYVYVELCSEESCYSLFLQNSIRALEMTHRALMGVSSQHLGTCACLDMAITAWEESIVWKAFFL